MWSVVELLTLSSWYLRLFATCFFQVQDLLLDLQHHVELLSRGNASLRSSMAGLRASSRDPSYSTSQDHLSQQSAVR